MDTRTSFLKRQVSLPGFTLIELLLLIALIAILAPNATPTEAGNSRPSFNVRDFGATNGGAVIQTTALQSAIDAAHNVGGGVVLFPAGRYLSGSLRVKSGVELRFEPGATLLGSASRADYQRARWHALLLAENQKNIAVTGPGVIDGQGRALAEDVIQRVKDGRIGKQSRNDRPDENERPMLIEFRNCRDVRVADVTLRNSSCWVQNFARCENLVIERIKVDSTAYWNNDGLDISDCRNVFVRGCDINSADDGICLKSEKRGPGCENVTVLDCRVRSSASAFKFGTTSHGGFRKIRVRNLSVYDTFRSAIALESVDGGVVEDVLIEHVRATNTGNVLFLRLGDRNTNAPIGRMENIVIRDVRVEIPPGKPDAGYPLEGPVRGRYNVLPSVIAGAPGHPIRNVLLEDIEICHPGGGDTNIACVPLDRLDRIPEQTDVYPEFSMFGELPAWGFYIRHAEGIRFRNVRITRARPDYRPALVFDHTARIDTSGLTVVGGEQSSLRTIGSKAAIFDDRLMK